MGPAQDRFTAAGIDVATVLECTTDCVVILHRAWRFVHINNRARALLGGNGDLVGEIIWEALPRPPGRAFETACRKAMAERAPVNCEDVNPRLGVWFENSIYPCADGIVIYMSHKPRAFLDRNGDRKKVLLTISVALTVGACAQPSASTSGHGGGMPSAGYADPYHYHCTGMCLRGAGG